MRHAQGHFSYNAAKGATVHLSKLMSYEFKEIGVRVNSIAPGYFPSEMTTGESDEAQKSHLDEEKVQQKGHVPMQRGGRYVFCLSLGVENAGKLMRCKVTRKWQWLCYSYRRIIMLMERLLQLTVVFFWMFQGGN